MKTHLIKASLLLMALSLALSAAAHAETYPVYEVTTRPAFLRAEPGFPEDDSGGYGNILAGVPEHSFVLVAQERDGWCLVMTQEHLVGYIQADDLRATGKNHLLDGAITPEKVSDRADIHIEYITIDPQAVLPSDAAATIELPAAILREEQAYDVQALLNQLLGEDYGQKARTEYDASDDYFSRAADRPERYASIYDDTGLFSYHDGMVAGERGAEYEPPRLNMTPEESLALCRALLRDIFPEEWLTHVGMERTLIERWNDEEERWLTEAEYSDYLRRMDVHYYLFEHRYDNGVKILDDELLAAVGVNGLSMFRLSWHDFAESDQGTLTPMPLQEAIDMANSTRLGPTVLLGAELVYSNQLTQSDRFNLSWYLITSKGNYVVDCVLREHICDSYEY